MQAEYYVRFIVTAAIIAGLPGEQSGPSIVDILYGIVNPSGRLPYTIARKSSDWPTRKFSSLPETPYRCIKLGSLFRYA